MAPALPRVRLDLRDKIDPSDDRIKPNKPLRSPLYVEYSNSVDISGIEDRLREGGEEIWTASGQSTNVSVHRSFHDDLGVSSIPFSFSDDLLKTVYRLPWWYSWKSTFKDLFEKQLGIPQDRIIRCLLARLPPGMVIPVHHDTGLWSFKSHRVHIPIITSEQEGTEEEARSQVVFQVGETVETLARAPFRKAHCIELNNRAKHAVANNWDKHRVHLIFDYVEHGTPLEIVRLGRGDRVVQSRRAITVIPAGETFEVPEITIPETPEEKVARKAATKQIVSEIVMLLDRELKASPKTIRLFFRACKSYGTGEMLVGDFVDAAEETLGDKLEFAFHEIGLGKLLPDKERLHTLNLELQRRKSDITGESETVPPPVVPTSIIPKSNIFMIIGVMKCGTTSLFDYLNQNSNVIRSKSKEPHVFDWKWKQVNELEPTQSMKDVAKPLLSLTNWLDCEVENHPIKLPDVMPSGSVVKNLEKLKTVFSFCFHLNENVNLDNFVAGEATPSYILGGEKIALRLKQVCPNVKIIVTLRDPVARAYSHYNMTADPNGTPDQLKRRGTVDGKSFEELLDEDWNELAKHSVDHLMSAQRFDELILSNRPEGHGSHSYVTRGLYAMQLEMWLKHFTREQFHFIRIQDMKPENLQSTMDSVCSFLGIPAEPVPDPEPKNARKYPPMKPETEAKLREFYKPHNDRLSKLLGMDFSDWN